MTPRDEMGRHKHKFFQRLTTNKGYPKLREHLGSVVTIMKLSKSYDEFKKTLDDLHPRHESATAQEFEENDDTVEKASSADPNGERKFVFRNGSRRPKNRVPFCDGGVFSAEHTPISVDLPPQTGQNNIGVNGRSARMDEDSKRREQIRARQAKDRARAEATEAQQKNALDRANEVRGLWTKAHETLIEVVGAWNRAFAEEGEAYRSFRLEPFRQPGRGELFVFDLYHLNSQRPNTVSVTHILVNSDGTVHISHPDVNRSIAVERIGKEDWDDVLSAIHGVDTGH